MPNNSMQWSSATPGLLVIMIDQSGTMTLPFDGGDSRSQFATKAVNRVIDTLIQKNFNGKAPKDRCYVSIIGYGCEAQIYVSGYLSQLKANPLRVLDVNKLVPNGDGGLTQINTKMPVWIDPIPDSCRETTDMMGAFRLAQKEIEKWTNKHPNNPSPIIINISDGLPYDGEDEVRCMQETTEIVNELKKIRTEDGYVQIFNAMIGDGAKAIFPTSSDQLNTPESKFLYEISTEIPDSFNVAAKKNQLSYDKGARGAIYNADAEYLVKLINFGSSLGLIGGDNE